ncbi:Hypothetical predicted protein [Cloeon dipterum]|uniref:Uncharacterized protein n=1 Tax=Cloeon dipterum TaxID=197152 RepID=A0A8S1DGD9_9INSE|nr:Hypothetical predicted protein [Cloeon dipterum]
MANIICRIVKSNTGRIGIFNGKGWGCRRLANYPLWKALCKITSLLHVKNRSLEHLKHILTLDQVEKRIQQAFQVKTSQVEFICRRVCASTKISTMLRLWREISWKQSFSRPPLVVQKWPRNVKMQAKDPLTCFKSHVPLRECAHLAFHFLLRLDLQPSLGLSKAANKALQDFQLRISQGFLLNVLVMDFA